MIDLRQELQSFQPIDFNNKSENSSELSDNVKNSILLYNRALESLRTGSEDIAIIQLKKAISLNPAFYESMNLLGICYSNIGDQHKAAEIFQKVIEAENNSIKALKYLNALKPDVYTNGKPEDKKNIEKQKTKREPVKIVETSSMNDQIKNLKNPRIHDFIKYSIGFLAGAITIILIVFLINGGNYKVLENPDDPNKQAVIGESTSKNKYDQLKIDYEKMKNDQKIINNEINYYENAVKLFDIDKLIDGKHYEEAADKLVLLKDMKFKSQIKKKYDSLINIAMPKAVYKAYIAGRAQQDSKKYKEALQKFNKIELYGNKWGYSDAALYNAGICFMKLNNKQKALEEFNKIKEKYPLSKYAVYSKYRINELTPKH